MEPLIIDLESAPNSPEPSRPRNAPRWLGAAVAVVAVLAVGFLLVAAEGDDRAGNAATQAPSTTAPTTSVLQSPSTLVPTTRSSSSSSPVISASSSYSTAANWVLQECLKKENGGSPSGPTQDMIKVALAYRACKDFLPPAPSLPDGIKQVYECVRANGIDADPRMPQLPVPLEVAQRAVAACEQLSLSVVGSSMPPEFTKCMQEQGVIVTLPIAVQGVDSSAANAKCSNLVRPSSGPPNYNAYFECLSNNGVAISTSAPPSASAFADAGLVVAAARACRSQRPSIGGPPEFADCAEDHGILLVAVAAAPAERREKANEACASKFTSASYPPSYNSYISCLADNGLKVPARTPLTMGGGVTADPATVTKAAVACRSQRPPGPPDAYANCMEEQGSLVILGIGTSGASGAGCSQHITPSSQPPTQPPTLPPAQARYEQCLRDNGLVVDTAKAPDFDQARKAFAACVSLAPAGHSD